MLADRLEMFGFTYDSDGRVTKIEVPVAGVDSTFDMEELTDTADGPINVFHTAVILSEEGPVLLKSTIRVLLLFEFENIKYALLHFIFLFLGPLDLFSPRERIKTHYHGDAPLRGSRA